MKKQFVNMILSLLLLSGCAITDGERISDNQVDSIKEGVTTKGEVRQRFGEPSNVTKSSGQIETWMYQYTEYNYIPLARNGGRYGNKGQMLMIMFSGDTVSSYQFTSL